MPKFYRMHSRIKFEFFKVNRVADYGDFSYVKRFVAEKPSLCQL
jgi:hypothetical protein